MRIQALLSLILMCGFLNSARGESLPIRVPSIFSDHMILQQGQPVPVWGWAEPDTDVTLTFHEQTRITRSDHSGRWSIKLASESASAEPRTLIIRSGPNSLHINDVLVGEVWLCSGQSNMAMTIDGKTAWLHVGGIANAKDVVRNSADRLLRQFKVEWRTDTRPQDHAKGIWSIANPDSTAEFSATAYFFGQRLRQKLDVPVAILNASFGGSSVEGWTSRDALKKHADSSWVAEMERLIDDYENHDRRIAAHVARLSEWERKWGRDDPLGEANDHEWTQRGRTDNAWKEIQLPSRLSALGCPNGGVIWLRKEVEIPREFGDAWRLDFPACNAFSTIYLNGQAIFRATASNQLSNAASRPAIPKGITHQGKNTLLIKLHAHAGTGGISGGKFGIVPFNPKFTPIGLYGTWSLGIESAFQQNPSDVAAAPKSPVKGVLHWMPVPSQFNAMIHPLIPYGIRGVVWYQGESNVGKSHYDKHLKILIQDWRDRWGQGDFPFYLCLLPGFGPRKIEPSDSPWAECREKQLAALELPNTAIANLIDTCEDGDLHPLEKWDAGTRLASAALANAYGLADVPWIGPSFATASVEGREVTVRFRNADRGLRAKRLPETTHPNLRRPDLDRIPLVPPSPGSELQGFALCSRQPSPSGGLTETWHNAQAKIEGNRVIVWSPNVPHPVAIRYAWADHPVCNLVGEDGLPSFPFRHTLVQTP